MLSPYRQEATILQLNLHSWSSSFPSWIWKAAKTVKLFKKPFFLQCKPAVPGTIGSLCAPAAPDHKLLETPWWTEAHPRRSNSIRSAPSKSSCAQHSLTQVSFLGHHHLVCGRSVLSKAGAHTDILVIKSFQMQRRKCLRCNSVVSTVTFYYVPGITHIFLRQQIPYHATSIWEKFSTRYLPNNFIEMRWQ